MEIRGDLQLVRVSTVLPDKHGRVQNIELAMVPKQDGSLPYKSVKVNYLKHHVSNIILLVESDEAVSS